MNRKWKFCRGEKHKYKSCFLVHVLLKLAYENQNLQSPDSEQEEVQVYWESSNTLKITGKNPDKKGTIREGTTKKALLNLVGEDDFTESDIRNSIVLLKSVPCHQNKDSSSKNKSSSILEEYKLPTLSQGIREFKLRIKGKQETLSENLKYVKKCIEKEHGKFKYSIQDENKTSPQNYQKLAKILSSLDCETQKQKFKEWINKKNNMKNRRGVFLVRTNYETMQNWFLWSLSKHIGGCDNAKKIITKINFEAKLDFNKFWQQFTPYIGAKKNENVDREIVIQNLTSFYRTESVIIFIKGYQGRFLQELSDFWSKLFEEIIRLKKGEIELQKLCLIIFLLPDCQQREPNPIEPQRYPILLEFNEIPNTELAQWLIKQQEEYKDEIYQWERGLTYLENFSSHPHTLIDEICKDIFKLKDGIAEVERCWKNFP